MYLTLVIILAVLFLAMLGLNLYFRLKVMRAYRELVRNEIDFKPAQIMNRRRVEEEIIPTYPEHADMIRQFSGFLKRSIAMGTVLLLLITLFGAVLMYYR